MSRRENKDVLYHRCKALDVYVTRGHTKPQLVEKLDRCMDRISVDPYSDWYDYEDRYSAAWGVWWWNHCCRVSAVKMSFWSCNDRSPWKVSCVSCGMDRTFWRGNLHIEIFGSGVGDPYGEDFDRYYLFFRTYHRGILPNDEYEKSYHITCE